MNIILVRHAIAMERDEFAQKFKKDDSLRPLVMKGKKRMFKVARQIHTWVPQVDMIVTSPFVRAQETAAIVKRFYPRSPVKESAELVPSAQPEAFLNWLHRQNPKMKNIIVVGHEPQMSTFAGFCLCGPGEAFIELKKAGALCLEIDSLPNLSSQTAQLKWLVTPKMIGN